MNHMTARIPRPGIHTKCLATTTEHGRTLVCWKSPEHIKSTDPARREHYDPSAERRWTA
jgi:hypothetical protein